MRTPFAFSHACTRVLSSTTSGTENSTPVEARTTFGLKISVTGSHTITASQPAASALRKMVPRFPGFSIASTTRKNGAFAPSTTIASKSPSARRHCGATASSPSGRSR